MIAKCLSRKNLKTKGKYNFVRLTVREWSIVLNFSWKILFLEAKSCKKVMNLATLHLQSYRRLRFAGFYCVTVRPCKGCLVTEQLIYVMMLTMLDMVRHIYLDGWGKVSTRQRYSSNRHISSLFSWNDKGYCFLPLDWIWVHYRVLPPPFSTPSGFPDSLLFRIYTPALREALKD